MTSERDLFPGHSPIHLPADTPPILSVVIHTEEEFDWSREHAREETGVEHMRHIGRAQEIFDAFGIVPNYVIDYPIASQPLAFETLRRYQDDGRALIGAHLHPWVSPPLTEPLSRANTYPGNLPRELEYEKLRVLTETIEANFGHRPLTYLAGRYGNGPHSADILEALGYEVDISVAPPIDYSADGGPDYSAYSAEPFWFGRQRRLLGLPGGGGYAGWLKSAGTPFYRLITHSSLRWARLPGITSRLRAFERIRLSPEDYTFAEMCRLTRSMLDEGQRIFVFSFHSPSVHPGFTPYVRDMAGLERFLDKTRRYFEWFMRELNGSSMTPLEIRQRLLT
ncbi:MAG: WalW protein [bacterium]|nr:MAG: WalW protein [bacterium]KAF0149834.1 MAG: WalW protein [bacterium]KAF0168535.1 MAG: WalW protein [bacterium]TXT19532.1 MAG: WalW protein [bacterium]